MTSFSGKNEISLLITDSGLGGLSVCADIVENLKKYRPFGHAKLTYFNAWPEQNRGYNLLQDMNERIRVFNRALIGMEKFKPDMIMIACNTLSTIYPKTEFSRNTKTPVMGIIDTGVEIISKEMASQPGSRVIILGTPATIESDAHRKALIEKGIPDGRIILQPCDKLAGEIEKDPASEAVVSMIDRYIGEASIKAVNRTLPVIAAFCCTHYGYSHDVFMDKLKKYFEAQITILNPNKEMSETLFKDGVAGSQNDIRIDLEVVSRIILSDEKIASISRILEASSPMTADALRNYRHDPDLFTF
jgi:glutamate racemase